MRLAREVKQIAITEAGCTAGYSRHLVALCSDDSIWEIDLAEGTGAREWKRLPDVPPRKDAADDINF